VCAKHSAASAETNHVRLSIHDYQNLFSVVHRGVSILGTTLLDGCEFEMEMKRLSM
jgi:hypothetical protein